MIDVASRYKDAEALTSKESSEIAECFSKIYSRKLSWPVTLIVDPGREFMGSVTKIMKQHGVTIQRGQAGNHRSQAFVERANRTDYLRDYLVINMHKKCLPMGDRESG